MFEELKGEHTRLASSCAACVIVCVSVTAMFTTSECVGGQNTNHNNSVYMCNPDFGNSTVTT